MAWSLDPGTVQDPTTNVVAIHQWGDAVNAGFDFLRGAKAGCHLTSLVGTASGSMPWGTELYDVNGCHSTASLTERIVVPSGWAGLWSVGCDISMSTDIFDVFIQFNAVTNIVQQTSNTVGAVESMASCQTIYPMVVGDYFNVFTVGGTARSTAQTSRFYAHWMQGI